MPTAASNRDNVIRYNSVYSHALVGSLLLSRSCTETSCAPPHSIGATDRLDIITDNPLKASSVSRDWPFPWLSVIVNGHSEVFVKGEPTYGELHSPR